MPIVFVPNPNFERELKDEEGVQLEIVEQAIEAGKKAVLFSPIDEGDYRRAFDVREYLGDIILTNTNFKAHWIEWGSVNNVASAPLRRGVLAAGLRFRATPKRS